MDHVHAVGTFVRYGGEMFRTEARLYFRGGMGRNLLLVGMNPGSSMLAHGKEKDLKRASEGQYMTGEIVMDKTMKHIIQMMDEACPDFKGTLYIVNLFNVRCGNMSAAIKLHIVLSTMLDYRRYLYTDMKEFMNGHSFSAVWLGWSLRDESHMNKRKRQVQRIVNAFHTSVAKYKDHDPKSIHVWHFKPLIPELATEYRNYVVPLLKNKLLDIQTNLVLPRHI